MTFAQHSIAGEVGVRPRVLNKKLILARQITQSKSCCLDLNRNSRDALYAILAFVREKNPRHAIYCRRESLLQECCITSERTLFRGLADLEDKDYILRKQARRRGGKYTVSRIRLTEKAILLLELENEATAALFKKKNSTAPSYKKYYTPEETTNTSPAEPSALPSDDFSELSENAQDANNITPENVFHNTPSANVADIYKEHTRESCHSYQRTLSDSQKPVDNPIDRTTRLPVRLLPLVDLGLSAKGVSRLMREAKAHGKRLEVVMNAIWLYIKDLNSRSVYSYILKCLHADQDFAYVAQQKTEDASNQQKRDAAQRCLDSLDHRFHGFNVLDKAGKVWGVLDAVSKIILAGNGVHPLNLKFGMALMEGEYRLARQ